MKSSTLSILIFSDAILEDGIGDSLRCFCRDPAFYTFLTYFHLFYFLLTNCLWSICNRCTYHTVISAERPLWPARGTWRAPRCVALPTCIFPGTMQIMTNSIILHYVLHANLTNSEESEGLAVLLKGMLAEWRIGKQHLPSPSPHPAVATLPHCCQATALAVWLPDQNYLYTSWAVCQEATHRHSR